MKGIETAWRAKHMMANVRTAQGKPIEPNSLHSMIGKTTPLRLEPETTLNLTI